MIMVIDKDNVLYLLESIHETENYLEAIDIENGECDFCDETGQLFQAKITSPVTTFKEGSFILEPAGESNSDIPLSFLARAQSLGKSCENLDALEDLKKFLANR